MGENQRIVYVKYFKLANGNGIKGLTAGGKNFNRSSSSANRKLLVAVQDNVLSLMFCFTLVT